jgi:hypothetical protein
MRVKQENIFRKFLFLVSSALEFGALLWKLYSPYLHLTFPTTFIDEDGSGTSATTLISVRTGRNTNTKREGHYTGILAFAVLRHDNKYEGIYHIHFQTNVLYELRSLRK